MALRVTVGEGAVLSGALNGVTVVEFAGRSAAMAGYLFQQMGAQVVRVVVGDAHHNDNFSIAYHSQKQTLQVEQLDLAAGSELAHIIAAADIVILDSVETVLRPGLTDAIAGLSARAIITEISTYGATGPKGGRIGGDLIAAAQSGFLQLTGTPNEEPVRMGGAQAVKLGGAEAVFASMVALHARDKFGIVQRVDVSVRDAMIRATVNSIPKYRYEQVVQQRVGDHWGVRDRPLKALWRCQDGWVSFVRRGGVLGGRVNETCISWMGEHGIDVGDLATVDWNTIDLGNDSHRELIDRLDQHFEDFLREQKTEEVFREGLKRGMTLAPVRNGADVLAESQFEEREYWAEQQVDGRAIKVPRFVVRSRTPEASELNEANANV